MNLNMKSFSIVFLAIACLTLSMANAGSPLRGSSNLVEQTEPSVLRRLFGRFLQANGANVGQIQIIPAGSTRPPLPAPSTTGEDEDDEDEEDKEDKKDEEDEDDEDEEDNEPSPLTGGGEEDEDEDDEEDNDGEDEDEDDVEGTGGPLNLPAPCPPGSFVKFNPEGQEFFCVTPGGDGDDRK